MSDWFESLQTDKGWEIRPNRRSARFVAAVYAGFLSVVAAFILLPPACVVGVLTISALFTSWLPEDWVAPLRLFGGGLGVIAVLPLLVAWAKLAFRQSLRKHWQTLHVLLRGEVSLGEQVLQDADRARRVIVHEQITYDGEGDPTVEYLVEVVQDRESAANVVVPIPGYGTWGRSVQGRKHATAFALALSAALGIPGPEGID